MAAHTGLLRNDGSHMGCHVMLRYTCMLHNTLRNFIFFQCVFPFFSQGALRFLSALGFERDFHPMELHTRHLG